MNEIYAFDKRDYLVQIDQGAKMRENETKEKCLERLRHAGENIIKAVSTLDNGEAVVALEQAKLDIMLNDNLVVLGGNSNKMCDKKLSNKPLFDLVQAGRQK